MGCDPLRMLGYSGLSRDMADSDGGSDFVGGSGGSTVQFRAYGYTVQGFGL